MSAMQQAVGSVGNDGAHRLDLGQSGERSALRVPMTSLIDVVFILLLFFMLATTFRVERVAQISTLENSSEPVQATENEASWLRVHADGTIQLDGVKHAVDAPLLPELLTRLAADERVVNVQAVQPATVQQLMLWLDRLAVGGVRNVRVARSVAP